VQLQGHHRVGIMETQWDGSQDHSAAMGGIQALWEGAHLGMGEPSVCRSWSSRGTSAVLSAAGGIAQQGTSSPGGSLRSSSMISARGEAKEDLVCISTFNQCSNVLCEYRKRNPKHKPLLSKPLLPLLPKMHCVNAAMLVKHPVWEFFFLASTSNRQRLVEGITPSSVCCLLIGKVWCNLCADQVRWARIILKTRP